ncbi:MAG: cytochrome c [Deferribacterales bacterium]
MVLIAGCGADDKDVYLSDYVDIDTGSGSGTPSLDDLITDVNVSDALARVEASIDVAEVSDAVSAINDAANAGATQVEISHAMDEADAGVAAKVISDEMELALVNAFKALKTANASLFSDLRLVVNDMTTDEKYTAFKAYIKENAPADSDDDDDDNGSEDRSGEGLYTSLCQGCHGAQSTNNIMTPTVEALSHAIQTGEGGMDSTALTALTEEELDAIIAYLTDVIDGEALYAQLCAGCHSAIATNNILTPTVEALSHAIQTGEGGMDSSALTALTEEELEAIIDALTGGDGGAEEPAGDDGETLYSANCQSCHQAKASTTVDGTTLDSYKSAISLGIGGMDTPSLEALTDEQLQAIIDYLAE